ncbi:MAG: winged helix-turn-helix domain-containing protein [Promethearchaeota archaeon]
MSKNDKLLDHVSPRLKLWLEKDGEMILGKGGALLLRAIEEQGSISQALKALPAEALGETESPSYRFAWGYLRKVEKRLGVSIVEKRRGHQAGTGGTVLTELGRKLLQYYEELEQRLEEILVTRSH